LASSPPSQNRRISRHGSLPRPSLAPNRVPLRARSEQWRREVAGTGQGSGAQEAWAKEDARGGRTRCTPPPRAARPSSSAGPRLRPKLRVRAPPWGRVAGWSCKAKLLRRVPPDAAHGVRQPPAPAAARPPAPRGAP
jgi:hypothetical protein